MDEETPLGIDPVASRRIFLGMLGLVAAGSIAFALLRRGAGPPPKEIAADPLLVAGREVYQYRCVSCHGASGRGDGPTASSLAGPRPRDFTGPWKYGDRPEDALRVIARGVPGTAMAGWANSYGPGQLRAVAAYVYYLAGRPVPEPLRAP
jgi:cytochrome c oxidase cbb3-type subunit III